MNPPRPDDRRRFHRLRNLPLIWKFLTVPLVSLVVVGALGLAYVDLRKSSLELLDQVQRNDQQRLQRFIALGSRMVVTYSKIYQLMLDARQFEREADFYQEARPFLDELHLIENTLKGELEVVSTSTEMGEELSSLQQSLERTRIAATNALLKTTVDLDLAAEEARTATREFNQANRQFLMVERMVHGELSERLASVTDDIRSRSLNLGLLFAAAFALALAASTYLITIHLGRLRKSILTLGAVTRYGDEGTEAESEVSNELLLLDRAIASVQRSYSRLLETRQSLETSNELLRQSHDEVAKNEAELVALNETLGAKVVELNEAISRRDEAENTLRQAQRVEAIGNLTGGVAHDFNNLLAIILGNLEILRDDFDATSAGAADQLKLIDSAIEAVDRGSELTRNMLSFARRARLQPTALDLNAIVRRTKNWAGRTMPAVIDIETSLLAGLWGIESDASSTESALLNLILNARDAMPDGGKLTIETANVQMDDRFINERGEDLEPGRYVMLAVSDTGVGIPQEVLDRIFDPFFTTKSPGAGTGLGLSMIHGFMKQSGGTVHVYSEPGVGTSFKLYFKAIEAEDAAEDEVEEFDRAAGTGARLLVVEDEPDVLSLISTMLSREGFQVRTAKSGEEALKIFEFDSGFDLLLTDIVMPGSLMGTALAKELRQRRPDLPVVFMSGYPREATVHGNGLRPEDIRLTKPVQRADLIRAVRTALSHARGDG